MKPLRWLLTGLVVAAILFPSIAAGRNEWTVLKSKAWIVEIKVQMTGDTDCGNAPDSLKVEDFSPERCSPVHDWLVALRTLARVTIRHLIYRLTVENPAVA